MSNVDIKTTPYSSDVEQYVRQYTSTEDPDCKERIWPPTTYKAASACPPTRYKDRDLAPQFAGADVIATLTFNTTMTGFLGISYQRIFI